MNGFGFNFGFCSGGATLPKELVLAYYAKNPLTSLRGPKPTYSDVLGGTPLVIDGALRGDPAYTNALPSGSEDFQTGWGDLSAGTTTVTPGQTDPDSDNTAVMLQGDDTNTWWGFSIGSNLEDRELIFYLFAKSAEPVRCKLFVSVSGGSTPKSDIEITSEWKLFSITTTTLLTDTGGIRVGINHGDSNEILVWHPQAVIDSKYLFPYILPGTSSVSHASTVGGNGMAFDTSGTQEVADGVELWDDPTTQTRSESNYSTFNATTGVGRIVSDGAAVRLFVSDIVVGGNYTFVVTSIEGTGAIRPYDYAWISQALSAGDTLNESIVINRDVLSLYSVDICDITFKLSVQKLQTIPEPKSLALRQAFEGAPDGVELVANGDFSDGDTGWSVGAGWTIADGKASCLTAVNDQQVRQAILVVGQRYTVTFIVVDYTSGSLGVHDGSSFVVASAAREAGKTYIYTFTAGGTRAAWYPQSFIGSISNISVQKLTIIPEPKSLALRQAFGAYDIPPAYTDYLNPVYPDYVSTGNTYYVRADGTATTLAEATSLDSAATSLNPSSFVSSTNVAATNPGDLFILSGVGGDYSFVYLGAGGTEDDPVTYKGDDESLPTFTGKVYTLDSYIDLIDLTSDVALASADCFTFDSDNELVIGSQLIGIRTYNLRALNSNNQGLQHEGAAPIEVTHYNLYAEGCLDEGVSCHGFPSVTIYGGAVRNCRSGINWIDTPVLRIYDMHISGTDADYTPIDPPSPIIDVDMDLVVSGCCLVHNELDSGWQMEFETGAVEFSNNEIYGLNDTFLAVFRPTMTTVKFTDNNLYGGLTPRLKAVIFNGLDTGDYSGNTFYTPFEDNFDGVAGDISSTTNVHATCTVIVLVKMGIGSGELVGSTAQHNVLNINDAASNGLLWLRGDSTTESSSVLAQSYDNTTYSGKVQSSWDRNEYHAKAVRVSGNRYQPGNKRYSEDGAEIDTAIQWEDLVAFDGSFDPEEYLRLFFNNTVPIGLIALEVWNKYASDEEILKYIEKELPDA